MDYKKLAKDWLKPISSAIILALLIYKFLFFNVSVPTTSMYPTIKAGDRIFVTRIHNKNNLKRGDIVVFYSDELEAKLIKRLIGLPGERVKINEDGQVFINGKKLDEPYVVNKDNKEGDFTVPKDKYLFLGDNRAASHDARYWAESYIDKDDILGKGQFILYPFKRFGKFVIGEDGLNH